MMILKCKICGGDIELLKGKPITVCTSCGSIMTVPAITDEQAVRLYNEANRLRRSNRFDAAYSVYEEIISAHPRDAEAYWGALLCHYGIEYVWDSRGEIYKPTFHKMQTTSILDDELYKNVIQCAKAEALSKYQEDACEIESIRQLYFGISQSKEPYDLFISYKQTNIQNGGLTKDFEIAQSIFNRLTSMGYRVFFSHVSLENEAGEAYEPIIFAALLSAKILLAVGTSKENYYSEWVKNEWQRYLQIKQNQSEKLLIPVFFDMMPADLPVEFSALQAVDYGRVGAIEDLLHFIEERIPNTHGIAKDQDKLIARAVSLMQEGNFGDAPNQYLENALNINPRNSDVYLYRLQREHKLKSLAALETLQELPDDHLEWKKALYTASESQKKALEVLRTKIMYSLALRCALATPQKDEVTIHELEEELRERWESREHEHGNPANYANARELLCEINERKDPSALPCFQETYALLDKLARRARNALVQKAAAKYINTKSVEGCLLAQKKLQTIADSCDVESLMKQCEQQLQEGKDAGNKNPMRGSLKSRGKAKRLLKRVRNSIDDIDAVRCCDELGSFREIGNMLNEVCLLGYSKRNKKAWTRKGLSKALLYLLFAAGGGALCALVIWIGLRIPLFNILVKMIFEGHQMAWIIACGIGAAIGAWLAYEYNAIDSNSQDAHTDINDMDRKEFELKIRSSLNKAYDAGEDLNLKSAPVSDVCDCVYLLQRKIFIHKFSQYATREDRLPDYFEGMIDYAERRCINDDVSRWNEDSELFAMENMIQRYASPGKSYEGYWKTNKPLGSDLSEFVSLPIAYEYQKLISFDRK